MSAIGELEPSVWAAANELPSCQGQPRRLNQLSAPPPSPPGTARPPRPARWRAASPSGRACGRRRGRRHARAGTSPASPRGAASTSARITSKCASAASLSIRPDARRGQLGRRPAAGPRAASRRASRWVCQPEPQLPGDQHDADDRQQQHPDAQCHPGRGAGGDQRDGAAGEQPEIDDQDRDENADDDPDPDALVHGSDHVRDSSNFRTAKLSPDPSSCSRPTVKPGPAGHRPDGGQHAGHERRPVQRIVTDGQRLPRAAQDDLLVRHQAGQPHRMHVDAVDGGAAGAVGLQGGGIGHVAESGVLAGQRRPPAPSRRRCRTGRRPCRRGAVR